MSGCEQCPEISGGNGMGDWSSTFQDMLKTWSAAGQQILLNLNQAKAFESTPEGTTVYVPGSGPIVPTGTRTTTQPPTPQEAIAGQGFSTVILLAGIFLLAYIMTNRSDD